MMAQCASFIPLVAALLINTLSYCSAENMYCVTPTTTSCSSCPHNTHCATLSEYAHDAEIYFTSNTTMVFLPGDHVLGRNIAVMNITRLTMRGESSSGNIATVVRNGSVGFSFTNMMDFNIYSLAFTSYNRSWSYGTYLAASNSALLLRSTKYARLVNCSFHDNLGTALAVHNTSVTLINNQFSHNLCGHELLFSDNRELGCGITALNSNLRFNGNTTFCENENNAIYYNNGNAGAIWASASSLDFNGTNNFIGNSAVSGGAIYAKTNSSLTFIGTSTFSYNSAEVYGGAINVEKYSLLRFLGTTTFSSNRAGYVGGAIDAYEAVAITFNGSSSFSSNSAEGGGAIIAYYNSTLTFDGNISFTNNGHNTNEIDMNTNTKGGAVYLAGSFLFLMPNTTVCFENNHASLGGAIYVFDINPLIYCKRIATLIAREQCFFQLPGQNLSNGIDVQLVFKSNSADTAGSVLYGGAIDNCKLTGLESSSW